MDTLSKEQRSALMKRVRRSDTAPELKLRKALHGQGLRYVVEDKRLPGSPDIVFPKHRTVVFVNGCFWHGHDCRQGRTPSTKQEFWIPKIEANKHRDDRKRAELEGLGWRVFTVWECQIKRLDGKPLADFAEALKDLITRGAVSSFSVLRRHPESVPQSGVLILCDTVPTRLPAVTRWETCIAACPGCGLTRRLAWEVRARSGSPRTPPSAPQPR